MRESEFKAGHQDGARRLPFCDRQTLARRVRWLLASEPEVTVIHLFWYHVFARQVLSRLDSARSAAERVAAATGIVAHWKAQGLRERVMTRILQEIFMIRGQEPPKGREDDRS